MKNKYYFAIILFILGVGCFVTYSIIGSQIASDGTLIESFGFIPVGFLLIAIALIVSVTISTVVIFHNPLKFDKWIFGLSWGFIILISLYFLASMSYLSERARMEISQPVLVQ